MRKTQSEISLKVSEDGASVLKDQNHERSEFGRKNNYLDYIYVTFKMLGKSENLGLCLE